MRGGTDIAVAAGNDHVEVATVLAAIDFDIRRDSAAPLHTFDVGDTRRVRAGRVVWVDRWVALKADIERRTTRDSVALIGTGLNVVCGHECEVKVGLSVRRCLSVGKRRAGTQRSLCRGRLLGVVVVEIESFSSIGRRSVRHSRRSRETDVAIALKSLNSGSSSS